MQPSPYTPGGTPRVLAGRSSELQEIRDFLAPLVAYKEMAGPMLVMHGPRGIGKTSLMSAATDEVAERGPVIAWVSCSRKQPFLADLAHSVDRALRNADALPAPTKWSTTLKRVGAEVQVPAVAKLSASVQRDLAAATPPAPAVSALEDLLHAAAVAAAGKDRAQHGVGLVVAIDELHAGSLGDLAVLLNAVQNLTLDRQQNPLAIIGAGLPSVRGILTQAATFGERSRWMGLQELSNSDLARALILPAAELDVDWDAEAVSLALAAAHGYPHFVQIMGAAAWRAARPEAGSTITVDHAAAAAEQGRREIVDLFRARWSSVSPGERDILVAAARLGGDGPVARRDLQEALGGDISVFRARLLDKAIVEDVERGMLRFTLPGFADFVLTEAVAE